MKMKKQLYFPLLLTLLASLVFGVFPLGQPSTVYAAPDFEYKKPTAFTDPGAGWNLEGQAYDLATPNDDTTAADSVVNPGDIDPWITFHTWGTKTAGLTYTTTKLFVNWKTNGAYNDDLWGIQYTDDGGTSWYDIVALGVHNDTAMVQSTITFATADQDLTQVQVKLAYDKKTGGDTGVTYIYDIWTEGTYTPLPSISNSPGSFDFGAVMASSTPNTTTGWFAITNSSNVTIDINIKCNGWSFTAGSNDWIYGASAEDTARLKASNDQGGVGGSSGAGNYDIIVPSGETGTLFCNDVATSTTTINWELQLEAPSSFTHFDPQITTVTLTATAA